MKIVVFQHPSPMPRRFSELSGRSRESAWCQAEPAGLGMAGPFRRGFPRWNSYIKHMFCFFFKSKLEEAWSQNGQTRCWVISTCMVNREYLYFVYSSEHFRMSIVRHHLFHQSKAVRLARDDDQSRGCRLGETLSGLLKAGGCGCFLCQNMTGWSGFMKRMTGMTGKLHVGKAGWVWGWMEKPSLESLLQTCEVKLFRVHEKQHTISWLIMTSKWDS